MAAPGPAAAAAGSDSPDFPKDSMGSMGSGIPVLEYPSVRVAYECLVKSFRQLQKQTEKEVAQVAAFCQGPKCSEGSRQECAVRMEKLAAKLQQLKNKVSEASLEAADFTSRCHCRLAAAETAPDLQALHTRSDFELESPELSGLVDRLLFELASRRGLLSTAQAHLDSVGGLRGQVEEEAQRAAREVLGALEKRDVGPALEWCLANRARLKKSAEGGAFESALQLQQLVALIGQGKHHEALTYARANITPQDMESVPEFRQALSLLAFAGPPPPHYAALLSEDRWRALAASFDRAFASVFGFFPRPQLELLLEAGCLAMRSPHCIQADAHTHTQDHGPHPTCPTCDPGWAECVRAAPSFNHAVSRLVCPLSGEPMGEGNPPMASPDGHVYSQAALKDLAARSSDGLIECPRTKQHYRLEQFQKIFVA